MRIRGGGAREDTHAAPRVSPLAPPPRAPPPHSSLPLPHSSPADVKDCADLAAFQQFSLLAMSRCEFIALPSESPSHRRGLKRGRKEGGGMEHEEGRREKNLASAVSSAERGDG